MRINVASLGCRLNQAELQAILTRLQEWGHEITEDENADIFIVNSCVVTVRSERKTRKLVNRAERAGTGSGRAIKIIVTGCAAQELKRDGEHYYVPNDYKYLIPELIEDWGYFESLDAPLADRFAYPLADRALSTRVNLKIQDGCDNFCSYCIIPYVRGASQSRDFLEVGRDFEGLVAADIKEIVLSGVQVGKYHSHGKKLADLVASLLETHGEFRLHLSSLSPSYLDEQLISLLSHPKLVKHLHLSLQSGSNKILSAMNRHYTREDFLAKIEAIKSRVPDFNFTTDLIVGFPGETEADFEDSLDLIKKAAFSHVHAFRFSPRPGTAAAGRKPVVSEGIKTERNDQVIALYHELKDQYYRRFEGKISRLLTERAKGGKTQGFNEYYVPVVLDKEVPANQFVDVKTSYEPGKYTLLGAI